MSMLRLMIVDDESYIRQGIRHAIPWESYGIEVIAEAENGRQALQMCQQLLPDIVLADIKMPQLSGLELAKILGERMPQIKVIILTAYSDPALFCDAIDAQVSSFVLKSADSDRILNAVLKTQETILSERESQAGLQRIQKIYQDNQRYIEELSFHQFFSHEISYSSFLSKAEALDLSLPGPEYALFAADFSANPEWDLISQIHIILKEYSPFIFRSDSKKCFALLNCTANGFLPKDIQTLSQCLQNYPPFKQLLYVDGIPSLVELPDYNDCLIEAFRSCFWQSFQPVRRAKKSSLPVSPDYSKVKAAEKAMLSSSINDDVQMIRQELMRYYDCMKEQQVPQEYFLPALDHIFQVIAARPFAPEAKANALSSGISNILSAEQIFLLFDDLFLKENHASSSHKQLQIALNYIEANFEKNILLSDVANHAYLSESYLSRIFKTELGFSFREWLNKVRIEKAKKLIAGSDLKYYEIAEKVGYKNYKYFAQHFSKYCGCSAKEYRIAAKRGLHRNAN